MTVKAELDADKTHIVLRAEWRYKDLCKTLPGARWSAKEDVWKIPVSWSGGLALQSTFRDALEMGPELTAWAIHERESRVAPATALRELTEYNVGYEDLYPYQRAGVAFLAAAKQAILADQPGLGKSAQSIRALATLSAQGEEVFPCLVVCPNTVKRNWQREFAKWWPGVRVEVITGTAAKRRKQFDTLINKNESEPAPHVVVINYEGLRSHSRLAPYGSIAIKKCVECGGEDESITPTQCEKHIRELNKIDFKSVIADEAHRLKDPKSKQSRAMLAASGDAKIRFALTGTPIAKDVLDLWAILHWLDPNEWPTKSRWVDRMIDTMMNAFGGTLVVGIKPDMRDEFFAALNPRMRRMLKSVVLPWLPNIIHKQEDVEMSAKQAKAYKQMRDYMIAQLEGTVMTAPSVMAQTKRLLQFASSYAEVEQVPYFDPETGEAKMHTKAILTEPSSTLDALVSDIQEGNYEGESVVVSAVSPQLLNLLSKRFVQLGIPHGMIIGDKTEVERQIAMDDFQSGRTKWILINQAGGTGITLTAAKYLVRLERPWSLIDDLQINDRVHRIGSEIHDSVIIVDYVTVGTVQEHVKEVLDGKGLNFEDVVQDQAQLLRMLQDEKAAK